MYVLSAGICIERLAAWHSLLGMYQTTLKAPLNALRTFFYSQIPCEIKFLANPLGVILEP
jgi:hypothetical protein